MVKSVPKWSKYILRALYTRSDWKYNKIPMLSDSTTAASKWFNIHLPQHDLSFICAKPRRFLSWADKVAYTVLWPLLTNHLPGMFNSLSHLLSHVGDLLTEMVDRPPLATASSLFVRLHSYHGALPETVGEYAEPAGYVVKHLNIPVTHPTYLVTNRFKGADQPV